MQKVKKTMIVNVVVKDFSVCTNREIEPVLVTDHAVAILFLTNIN